MKKLITLLVLLFLFIASSLKSQELPSLRLNDKDNILRSFAARNYDIKSSSYDLRLTGASSSSLVQIKTRKAVNMYIGAGYSFVIFTSNYMNTAYPVLDTRSGDFLSEVNLYFGFAVAKAVTFEFEPSILFTHNNRAITIILAEAKYVGGQYYNYAFPQTLSMLSFPLAVNVRFFPMFATKGFGRLFFIGGGLGGVWIREEYDNIYSNDPNIYFGTSYYAVTESTSQWAPLLRIMTGFTGTGGAYGFGGEIRYNFVPLKHTNEPFATRIAANYNSVDLSLRFYFSL